MAATAAALVLHPLTVRMRMGMGMGVGCRGWLGWLGDRPTVARPPRMLASVKYGMWPPQGVEVGMSSLRLGTRVLP